MPTEAQAQSENTPPSKDQEVNDDQENAVMSPKLDNNNNSKKLSSSQNNMSRSTRRSSAASSLNTIKRPLWKKKISKFLDSTPVLIIMSIFTVYCLFMSDIQAACIRIEFDFTSNVIQCVLLAIFSIEWILNIIAKKDYIWSFFFWLDLISTISLIQDIDWIMNPLLGYSSNRANANRSSVQAAKAVSKVSSASRATRVLRVIRIVRLIRMVKLYKSIYIAKQNQENKEKENKLLNFDGKNERVSDKTLDSTNKSVNKSNDSSSNENRKNSTNSLNLNQNNLPTNENNHNEENNNNNNNNNNTTNNNKNNNKQNNNNKEESNHNKTINNDENEEDKKENNKEDNQVLNINKKDKNKDSRLIQSEKSKSDKLLLSENELNKPLKNKNDLIESHVTPTTNQNLLQQDNNDKDYSNKIKFIDGKKAEKKKKGVKKSIKKSKTIKGLGDQEEEVLDEEDEEKLIKESRISRLISDSLTKKTIVLIMILLIIFPFLGDDFYSDTDKTSTYSLIAQYVSASYDLFDKNSIILNNNVLSQLLDEKYVMLNMTHNGTIIYYNDNYSTNYFRYKEVQSVFSDDGYVQIVYSLLKETKLTAVLNIGQTIFVCIMLTGAVLLFEYDARTLVLEPLEVMIEIVDTVARDPINAKNVENLQTGVKAAMLDKNNSKTFKNNTTFANRTLKENQNKNDQNEESYEVSVIKAAIIKISALLAIGFGEAGGEIIKKNLTSGQDLNPRLRGKKKTAIFGFCDIRQFEEINLALEEKTILLINEIADIIHSSVDRFGGATNKNIGESFLNVWKFYNETPVRDAEGNVTMERKDNLLEIDPTNPMVEITADESVCACLRCIKKINKSYNILSYGKNEEILKRIPNFKLNMGFGLHIGYGIEGAVGSTYKIDASYLSPNVNIAARLETATRQFGLSLLVSGPLYQLLSEDMKRRMRFVDCVNVKGSVIPLDLYTIDVNLDLKPQEKKISIMSPKDKRKRYQDKKELFQREIEMVKSVTNIIFEKDSYIELTRTKKTDEFYHEWEEGVKFYKNGYFKQAAEQYEKCLKIDPDDGPAKTLLTYIKNRNYKKPEGWKGVRELTSK